MIFGSKSWANSILRQNIKVCIADYSDFPIYLQRTLEVKFNIEILEDYGFVWQAKTLQYWLHKLYRNHTKQDLRARADARDTLERERERVSNFPDFLSRVYFLERNR